MQSLHNYLLLLARYIFFDNRARPNNEQDAILFAKFRIIDNEEKLEQERLNNKISIDVYNNMKNDNIRRSKIFEELRIKIENTPRCK